MFRTSHDEICGALAHHLCVDEKGNEANGCVVCCRRTPCVCVFSAGSSRAEGSTKKGEDITTSCVAEHEMTHAMQVTCPSGDPIPQVAIGTTAGECAARQVQLGSLRRNKRACGTDGDCLLDIEIEIKRVQLKMDRLKCNQARPF